MTNFRSDINGLRALAVTVVVLFHFGVPYMEGGFVGVDVFFVISGFLMTGIIFNKTNKSTFSIIDFYVDRARRIIPALLGLCSALLIIGWFLLLPTEYQLLSKYVASSLTFFSNITYALESSYFDVGSHEKWLLHTWSLSVEWQFYILYPIFLVLLKKILKTQASIRLTLVVCTLLSLALSIIFSHKLPTQAFFLLPTRAWEMLAGGLIFLYPYALKPYLARVFEYVGLILIGLSVLFLSEANTWPGYLALIPVIGTMLIIIANRPSSVLMGNPISQFLGKISYSIYLWHWPIVVAMYYFNVINYVVISLGIIASIIMGFLSFSLIESKTKNISKKYPIGKSWRSPQMLILMSCIGVAFTSAMTIYLLNGVSQRVSYAANIADLGHKDNSPLRAKCFIQQGVKSPDCLFGDTQTSKKFVYIGDSHALSLLGAAKDSLNADQSLLFKGYSGCPTVLGVKHEDRADCGRFISLSIEEINTRYANLPIIVTNRRPVFLFQDPAKHAKISFEGNNSLPLEKAYREHYIKTMCALSAKHQVFVTLPIPEPSVNIPQFMARNIHLYGASPEIKISLADYQKQNAFILGVMDEAKQRCGIHLVDTTKYLCGHAECNTSINQKPLYYDDNHLGEFGNRLLIPMFKDIYRQSDISSQ